MTGYSAYLPDYLHATSHESVTNFCLCMGPFPMNKGYFEKDGKFSTKLYGKRDDFNFNIVNFPFLSSYIPSESSYGVYISQLFRYARCCSYCDDFRHCHKMLVERLVSQG